MINLNYEKIIDSVHKHLDDENIGISLCGTIKQCYQLNNTIGHNYQKDVKKVIEIIFSLDKTIITKIQNKIRKSSSYNELLLVMSKEDAEQVMYDFIHDISDNLVWRL